MPNYELDRLGDKEFERLVQALLKKIIGAGTITFGNGPDGGREATYAGKAPYPSPKEQWGGHWIFQAKFHDTGQVGPDKARRQLLSDLKSELEKITAKHKRKCDNYILATNVRLTSVSDIGTHDKINAEVLSAFTGTIPHVHVWGYDDICRFLDCHPDIRQSYLHLITPGDLVAELIDRSKRKKTALAEAINLYVRTSFEREQFAQLDQAGEVGEKPMPLRRVFIDLNVKIRTQKDLQAVLGSRPDIELRLARLAGKETLSAMEALVSCDIPKVVLIGGPGQGKSTLGQFVAQVHRAHILGKIRELNGTGERFVPSVVRVPFRIILKDYAQWMVDTKSPHSLERFLAALASERAGRPVTSEQIQGMLGHNPVLLILDGLDEVTDTELRSRMLQLLAEFVGRCEDVLGADLQVIATSRPIGYSDQFDPSHFLHLSLVALNRDKVIEYTERWTKAKALESAKGSSLRASVVDCLGDSHFSLLMTTPLQVTIFILIILGGGNPPHQREELFNEYLEVIYKRERAKSKTIIQTDKRLLLGLHRYIGYLLHKHAGASADIRSRMHADEFGDEVFRYLRYHDPYSNEQLLQEKCQQLIKEAHERLVLLTVLEDGFYGFELRSIQEFFAAGYLADTAIDNQQRFRRFRAIALPPHWRNVALFFAGRVGRCYPGEAAHILETCRDIDRQKPDILLSRGAWLALEIAVDRSFGPDRMLQRSAVEYGLTLLDGDLDREKRSELVARLRQLPEDDLDTHVRPVLERRLGRAHWPETFHTVEVHHQLFGSGELMERMVASAVESGCVDSLTMADRILEYRLSPAYLATHLAAFWKALPPDPVVDLMARWFAEDPGHVAELMQAVGFSGTTAIAVLDAALEVGVREPRGPDIVGSLKVAESIFDQARSAWELVATSRYGRRPVPWMLGNRYDERTTRFSADYLYHLYRFDIEGRFRFDYSYKLLDDIAGVVADQGAIPQLRGAALGLAELYLLLGREKGGFDALRSLHLSSVNEPEREIVERVLYWQQAPSLESTNLLMEDGLAELLRAFPDLWSASRISSDEVEAMLALAALVDPLDSRYASKVLRDNAHPGGGTKGSSWTLARVLARTLGLSASPRLGSIRVGHVVSLIDVIAELLKKGGPQEWRAWACLSRVANSDCLRWTASQAGGSKALRNSLHRLCDAVESDMSGRTGRWELVGVVASIAGSAELEGAMVRLLGIIARIPEGLHCNRSARGFRPLTWESAAIEQVFQAALGSGETAFRGFLKWFAVLMPTVRAMSRHADVEMPLLHLDPKRVHAELLAAEGLAREGAILLLAYCGSTPPGTTSRLLQSAYKDRKPIDRAWASLVSQTVRNLDTQDAVSFLEGVLASGAECPKAARYAALDEYHLLARGATTGVEEQEKGLGLPLQSNTEHAAL